MPHPYVTFWSDVHVDGCWLADCLADFCPSACTAYNYGDGPQRLISSVLSHIKRARYSWLRPSNDHRLSDHSSWHQQPEGPFLPFFSRDPHLASLPGNRDKVLGRRGLRGGGVSLQGPPSIVCQLRLFESRRAWSAVNYRV